MSELTKFECNVTGKLYGAKNDVYEYELRHLREGKPFEMRKRVIHLSDDAIEESDLKSHYNVPSDYRVAYIGVQDGEIAGMMFAPNNDGGGIVHGWHERDHVVTDHYTPFYEYLEEEVLY